ncbi:DUF58 domain-containing protein [Aquihabitans sp. G128]|uniref:DUF58 domain-containing protein n=1 Tax=Aquihabitans sp. G128 TaxID=2849779 RepID=UPI001C2296D6|nr:DUF58 domain-containing protein [Aquihabitans sp. G128]QXC60938.1 DUF58 domain-containing protein [Aquihabitans sp. G128]
MRIAGVEVPPEPAPAPTPGTHGAAAARRPRSLPARGGGYDRVGGSRLTPVGAVLVAAVVAGALSPPTSADHEVVVIVWAALVGVLALGIVAPLVLVRRVRIEATSARDATVGEEVDVDVRLLGRVAGLEVRALDPTGPWHRAAAPGGGRVLHLADHRGVFQVVRIEVRVTAPLGVLAAHRVHAIELPMAVEVAPRALAVTWLPAPAPVEGGSGHLTTAALTGDLVRSVRPYVSGDPSHLVHWPSSARLGELVVRELEPPTPLGQAVVVDLTALGDDTERAASLRARRAVPCWRPAATSCSARLRRLGPSPVGSAPRSTPGAGWLGPRPAPRARRPRVGPSWRSARDRRAPRGPGPTGGG